MAQLPEAFDPQGDYDLRLLPDGQYLFDIVDSEFCEGQKEGSTYIKLTFDGVDGTASQGVRIWQNYTYDNKNAGAVARGRRDFKKVCLAAGVGERVTDTAILHGRRVLGSVYTEEGTGGYDDKNQLRDYQSASAAGATGAPPVPQAQPQAAWQPPAGAPPPTHAAPQYQQPAAPAYQQPAAAPPQQYAQQPAQAPQQYAQPPAAHPPAQQPAAPPAPQAPAQAPQGAPPANGAPGAPPWAQ